MTASTQIKLSPAMVTALEGAVVEGAMVRVVDGTKAQTVKGLESRGLTDSAGYLTPEGVEAARQLGNDTTTYNEKAPETPSADLTDDVQVEQQASAIAALEDLLTGDPWGSDVKPENITPELIDQAAENLLKAVDLDKPQVVPNRADKRYAKFSLRGALSRLAERKRVRQIKKYGTPKIVTSA